MIKRWITTIKDCLQRKPSVLWGRAYELLGVFKASGIWGAGWLPSPLFDYHQAKGLADYYGIEIKFEGGVSRTGQWTTWYVYYPKERWASDGIWIPKGVGIAPTLGEALVRLLLDCKAQGILGEEQLGPKEYRMTS